ncbi:hypothetical protein ACHWQZ_G000440 [Mnemiopsis leidyi]
MNSNSKHIYPTKLYTFMSVKASFLKYLAFILLNFVRVRSETFTGWTEWEDITVRDPNWMPIKPLGEYLFSVQTGPQHLDRILGIRFYLRSDENDDEGALVNINVPPASGGQGMLLAVDYCRDTGQRPIVKKNILFSVNNNPSTLEWHFINTDSEFQLWSRGEMISSAELSASCQDNILRQEITHVKFRKTDFDGSSKIRFPSSETASCSAGDYKTEGGECQQCEANTFSGAGASNCSFCPDGTASVAGSTSEIDCKLIPCSGASSTQSTCEYVQRLAFGRIQLISANASSNAIVESGIDENLGTETMFMGDGNSIWYKVYFDGLYCVDNVMILDSGSSTHSWSCLESGCGDPCEGEYCKYIDVSVFNEHHQNSDWLTSHGNLTSFNTEGVICGDGVEISLSLENAGKLGWQFLILSEVAVFGHKLVWREKLGEEIVVVSANLDVSLKSLGNNQISDDIINWNLSVVLQDVQCDPAILSFDHINCAESSCANPCEENTCDKIHSEDEILSNDGSGGQAYNCGNVVQLMDDKTQKVLDFGFFEVAIIRQKEPSDDCDPGYTVSQNGTCLQCPAGYFSASGTATNCSQCPDNKFSPPGSDSETDCKEKVYFRELQQEKNVTSGITLYTPNWNTNYTGLLSLFLHISRTQLDSSDCDVILAFADLDFEIEISISTLGQYIDRFITVAYDGNKEAIEIANKEEYGINVDFDFDTVTVTVTWNGLIRPKRIRFRKQIGASAVELNDVKIEVSNKPCLDFDQDISSIELGKFSENNTYTPRNETVTPKNDTVTPKNYTITSESKKLGIQSLAAELCAAIFFRDCVLVQLPLNHTWSDFYIRSLLIHEIPANRGIRVTASNNETYLVVNSLIDSNLNDGVSQLGLYLENEGGQYITELTYIEYDQKPYESILSTEVELEENLIERDPINYIEFEGETESEYVRNYDIEKEPNEEVKDLILENKIQFVVDEEKYDGNSMDDLENEIKVWKPNFQGSTVPIKVFSEKAQNFMQKNSSEAKNDLVGYLAYNGFVDVGLNIDNQKKQAKQPNGDKSGSISRDAVIDEDAMIETIKAFQKFNGFPETGQLTDKEMEVILKSDCGNRDTSYKDQVELFTCVEAEAEIVSDVSYSSCDLDTDTLLDICSHYPHDHIPSDDRGNIDKFVWNNGYYFEADIDFKESETVTSHVGIAFNYEDSSKTADYVLIQYETEHHRLVFSYGIYKQGKRETTKRIPVSKSLQLDRYQKRYRQFKIKLTMYSGVNATVDVSVNSFRIFSFEPNMPAKSSVYVFTLGGGHYVQHKVRIFTSRICRRNSPNGESSANIKHSRIKKRVAHSKFRWYPNGGDITYAFTNYSTTLGSERGHAYSPIHSEIHFNDHHIFSVSKGERMSSMKYVALHEIGHALGIRHSTQRNAVMHKEYPGDSAYEVEGLDKDDVGSLSSLYGEMFTSVIIPKVSHSEIDSLAYEAVKGIQGLSYEAKLPLPGECLDRIDAAFYFYDTDEARNEDKIYLMSHGFLWVYNTGDESISGRYPKSISTVFNGAPAEIDAAFDTGSWVYFISGKEVFIYKVGRYGGFVYHRTTEVNSFFKISLSEDERIISAFNHLKKECTGGSDTACIRTTLVIDNVKSYKVIWRGQGAKVFRTERINSADIIGRQFGANQFGAAYEQLQANGSSKVVMFQKKGRDGRRRVIYPGADYNETTTWFDVPAAYGITGWCGV